MTIQSKFEKFHDTIKLSNYDDAYKDAKEKGESITKEIKAAFNEKGYPVVADFLQGSFAMRTAVKSLDDDFDMDQALVIERAKSESDPVNHKITAKDVLDDRGFKDAKIKMPCVTADYLSLNLHIDYTIYRSDSLGSLELAVGKLNSSDSGKKWEPCDPKGLIDWVNALGTYSFGLNDDQKKQFKRLVRYLKRWRDVQYTNKSNRKKLYSIGLVIMLRQQLSPSLNNGTPNDLLALYDTVDKIIVNGGYFTQRRFDANSYDIKVNLPVAPYRDVFVKHGTTVGTELRNKLIMLRKKLREAIDEKKLSKQCEILRTQFGSDFPPADESEDKSDDSPFRGAPGIVTPNQGA